MKNTNKLLLLFLITFTSIPTVFALREGSRADLEKFAKTGECEECDLRYFDLRGHIKELLKKDQHLKINLKRSNLEGTDLRKAYLVNANFEDTNLKHAKLQFTFLIKANLERADLRYANLRGSILNDANLRFTNLKGTIIIPPNSKPFDFETRFDNTVLDPAKWFISRWWRFRNKRYWK